MNDTPAKERPVPPDALLDRFAAIVGEKYTVREASDMAPHLVELRGLYEGRAALVLRPGSTDEVSRILALANETGTPVVPQGGNTGLVGGQIPFDTGNEVIVSLTRMNRIRTVDSVGNAMTVDAGVTLAQAREAADAADRLFPLSLPSEGSCQIGGNLSTNAGGAAVLAYGNTRELTLGLEVVLADGRVWDGLRSLRKDNTGYDLKDLFIGAEGTLGIITGAVLKLFPKPESRTTAIAGLSSVANVGMLFEIARRIGNASLTAFEIVPRIGIEYVLRHGQQTRDPLQGPHDWYALLELSGQKADGGAEDRLEAILTEALEAEIVEDAAIAASLGQSEDFWRLRELLSEVQGHEGGSIKHDVSVPVALIPEFVARASETVTKMIPGARPVPFGHYGDGNIHYNVSQPPDMDKQAFMARWDEVNAAVHAIVKDLNGSISAEHGIGRMKRDLLPEVKSAVELDLMRAIKKTLDPNGILNPGKLL
jgi:FAD/FMN-containing dehydrogenase